MAKYVVIVGCLLKGERCTPGDIVKPEKGDATQLVAMGRIVDVSTKEGAISAEEALGKPKGKGKMPGADD